jgi:thymidylate kinase
MLTEQERQLLFVQDVDSTLRLMFAVENQRFSNLHQERFSLLLDRTILTAVVTNAVRIRLGEPGTRGLASQLLGQTVIFSPDIFVFLDIDPEIQAVRWRNRSKTNALFVNPDFSHLYRSAFFHLSNILPIKIIRPEAQPVQFVVGQLREAIEAAPLNISYDLRGAADYLLSKL